MQRVFYPIGQGGFHSETFDAESYVYDCGARPQINITIIDDYVSSVKSEKIKIITIFISHFDCDHVNGIPELIEKLLLLNKKIFASILYGI